MLVTTVGMQGRSEASVQTDPVQTDPVVRWSHKDPMSELAGKSDQRTTLTQEATEPTVPFFAAQCKTMQKPLVTSFSDKTSVTCAPSVFLRQHKHV